MEVTDEIKEENEAGENTDDLFYQMLNGQTAQETISTSRGDFVIKYPKQKDIITIARTAAFMRAGIPAANFDTAGDYEIQKIATLDITVESGPAWFNKAKKKPGFSWRDVPDANFVDEIYAKALSFRQEVQEQLNKIKKPHAKRPDGEVSGSVPADVDDGLFSEVTSTHPRDRT
jgi:hypothetical protein